jgi:retron-type reverse transcriptase
MKTYKNLFPEVASFGNLHSAWRKARRGKRSRPDVLRFDFNQESEILALERELQEGTYRPGAYRNFVIHEPKRRIISAAPFRDRVVHHAICNVLEPIFERRFIYDTYACRRGKGTHRALDRFTHYARRYAYVLKADIVQYFPSIDHEILLGLLARRIADNRLVQLIALVLEGGADVHADEQDRFLFPGDDLLALLRPRGLPIGNLTSQFFANVYLDTLDHHIKEALRVRGYVRYCDDFVLFGDSREELLGMRDDLFALVQRLRLRLHKRKTVVYRADCGVPFLGFLIYPEHRRLRRRNVISTARRLKEMSRLYAAGALDARDVRQRLQSWIGHVMHGDTWALRRRLLSDLKLVRHDSNAGHAHFRKDVRLEPVAVLQNSRLPKEASAFTDTET